MRLVEGNMYSVVRFFIVLVLGWGLSACSVFRTTENFAVINLKPSTPEYYEFIALNYYQRGNYRQAILYYQALVQRFSERPEIYDTELAWAEYEIGFCHYKLNEFETAYAQFKKVVSDHKDLGAITLSGQRIRALEKEFPALRIEAEL